jgi:GTP-binding protein
LRVVATRFIRSAARPADFPADGCPEVALVGRSNVGKSSLINALVRQDVARTSAAPGKTRLVNIYRVELERLPGGFYLVDLPGYGHAGGGDQAKRDFDRLTGDYFRGQESGARGRGSGAGFVERSAGLRARVGGAEAPPYYARSAGSSPDPRAVRPGSRQIAGVVLAVDARHPGLERDVAAYRWLLTQPAPVAVVATKIDKLTQAERARLGRHMETSFGVAALAVSVATGEGLEQLWKHLLKWIRHN